jgi:hypothetical protein
MRNTCLEFASIASSERSALQSVLSIWCEERDLSLSAPETEAAASELLDLYSFGIRKPDELLQLIRTI